MALAWVQSRQQTGGGTTTTVRAYASNVGANNLLTCAISSGGPSAPASGVTDSQGNTWTQAGTATQASGGDYIQIFYAIAGSSAADTVTVTFPGSSQGDTITIHEFSGNATSSVLDNTTAAIGTSTTPASGALTPSVNGCLLFVAEVDPAADGTTYTAGTDFTIDQTQLTSSTLQRIGTEYYIQPTAASHNGNFTIGASAAWACKLAIFKPLATTVVLPRKALLGVGR